MEILIKLTTYSMKQCKKCEQSKDLSDYSKHSSTRDRLRPECKVCEAIAKNQRYLKNKESHLIKVKEWREANKELSYSYNNKWKKENNEKYKDILKDWEKRNKHKRRSYSAKRRVSQLQASLNYNVYKDEIEFIYLNCPEGMEVDHIVPLQGKNVRGLHVPWNLQYLSIFENRSKKNKHE